ncbi:hypothetical protein POPTR_014G154850v4 [Populus trichocarpa]|jgi:hypothetical protein|uniref:Uncharacterized protein n=1 Tax=Populus trichocarpa TaxID=3694 RepID=A0ACC0RZC2_POPTR|nr:hypothetical protein POPTR_014G154850v4 [Populus trichocarpa]
MYVRVQHTHETKSSCLLRPFQPLTSPCHGRWKHSLVSRELSNPYQQLIYAYQQSSFPPSPKHTHTHKLKYTLYIAPSLFQTPKSAFTPDQKSTHHKLKTNPQITSNPNQASHQNRSSSTV